MAIRPGILAQGPDRVVYLPIEKKIEKIPVSQGFVVPTGVR
jgi:hypothetical protein